VLEIGTGLGYQTAILAQLARKVYSVEIIEELGQQAKKRLRRRTDYRPLWCWHGYYASICLRLRHPCQIRRSPRVQTTDGVIFPKPGPSLHNFPAERGCARPREPGAVGAEHLLRVKNRFKAGRTLPLQPVHLRAGRDFAGKRTVDLRSYFPRYRSASTKSENAGEGWRRLG
jgi:protein-L-isoaspartate(D-aspartate) O-methyltransferase (PCMT)